MFMAHKPFGKSCSCIGCQTLPQLYLYADIYRQCFNDPNLLDDSAVDSKLARNALFLHQYQYEILHTKSSENCQPDFYSSVGLKPNDDKQQDEDEDID